MGRIDVIALFLLSITSCHAFAKMPGLLERHFASRILRRGDSVSNSSLPVTILDNTGSLQLNPGIDGNLFISRPEDSASISTLVPGSFQFLVDTESLAILSDNANPTRLLYYYPAEISAVGVSRLRLGAWGAIPMGTQLVAFVPFDVGDDKILAVLDTNGNYFWPTVCGFSTGLNKVFITNDTSAGPGILQSNGDLRYIISGGDIEQCGLLALVAEGLYRSY
jgi:hypothetical protein